MTLGGGVLSIGGSGTMHHLTLRQFEYFAEIVDAGNITRAAARLHVAPTALSLQVRAMEEVLGTRLLERHSRGVRPTEVGTELYRKARQIIEMVDDTERLGTAASARPLRLGVIPPMLRLIGVDAVVAGEAGAEGQAVQIVEGLSSGLTRRLEERDVDFILAYEVPAARGIETVPLLEDHFLFVTSPQEARADGRVTLAEALGSDLVFYSERTAGWRAVQAAARAAGLTVRSAQKVGSSDVIRHLVARGLATAFMPFGLINEEVERGEIAVHEVTDCPVTQRVHLAWLKDTHADEVDRMLAFVTGVVADQVARTKPHARLLRPPDRAARRRSLVG